MSFVIGTPHRHNAGYLINNQNLGVTHGRQEADIQTCSHCQKIINMQVWRNDGAFCRRCWSPICAQCGDRMLLFGCEPFVKKLEEYTNTAVKFAQYLRMSGLEPAIPPRSLIVPG